MSFKGKLLEPQKPAALKLMNRQKMLLAWEQGTGKTVISLAAACRLMDLKPCTSALVLAPSGLTWQWEEKIKEFTTRSVERANALKKKTRIYEPIVGGFYTVGYRLFLKDYDKIVSSKWDIVIADEAQEFSNFRAKTAQYMKRMNVAIKPKYRWALTGTAVSNNLEELYSIFYWVDPHFLPPWPRFQENHIVDNGIGAPSRYKNLQALNKYLTDGKMDRKTAKDMDGHMPEIVYDIVTIPRSREYETAEKRLLTSLDEFVGNISFDEEGNPKLPPQHPVRKAFAACKSCLWTPTRRSEVLHWIDVRLKETGSTQVVLFSSLKQPLYELKDALGSLAALYTGDQSSEAKRSNVLAFREGKTRVLLCSNAGNAGLDLPQARYLGNIDTPLSFGQSDQRDKRIARISSEFPYVAVTSFLMPGMELYFYLATKRKGLLAGAALDGGADEVVMRPQSLRSYLKEQNE